MKRFLSISLFSKKIVSWLRMMLALPKFFFSERIWMSLARTVMMNRGCQRTITTVSGIAIFLFATIIQADSPIPKIYGAGDVNYGPPQIYESVETACAEIAALRSDLSTSNPPSSIFLGFFIKSRVNSGFVEGVLPYNTLGLWGWDCYAKYKSTSPSVYEYTYDYGSALPVCPPSYAGGSYTLASGADTCPNNPQFWVRTQPKESGCCDVPTQPPMLGDPINAASGNVYKSEHDMVVQDPKAGLPFNRFYNSLDLNSHGIGAGWRHSFSRQILAISDAASYQPYIASDTSNSSLYQTAALACTNGFAQIKSKVPNWLNATASYTNDVCTLQAGGVTIGTLAIQFAYPQLPPPRLSVLKFNVVRDDGSTISFLNQGGVPVAPFGTTLRLQKTSNGYTLTDSQDTVEIYDTNGKLLSVASRTGAVQTMSYDSSDRLNAVTDNFGHSLTLSYDGQDRLAVVTRQ